MLGVGVGILADRMGLCSGRTVGLPLGKFSLPFFFFAPFLEFRTEGLLFVGVVGSSLACAAQCGRGVDTWLHGT